ncbi:MAG: hypothetical protein K2I42_00620, partial [Anaeroplasmataceae bacterium]|nr:hypothetical protein [Anaeroplasmataceae bacterium]
MRKIRQFLLFSILIIFSYLLISCSIEKIEISATITSIHAEENSISFYVTILTNKEIDAKAELESTSTNQKYSIDSLILNETKEYLFDQLEANENYRLSISYSMDKTSYITIAQEYIQTKESKRNPLEMDFSDQEYVFDGEGKTYLIDSSLEFDIQYTLNSIIVDKPVHAGVYDVFISFAGNDEYLPYEIHKKLTIKKASLEINYKEKDYIYNGNSQKIEFSSNYNVPIAVTYYMNDVKVDSCIDAGTYNVVLSFEGNEDIDAFVENHAFTIQKANKDFILEDINVSYLENYEIYPLISEQMDYVIEYYLNGEILSDKPYLPGEYSAVVHLNHKNYSGSKICKIQINKIDYFFDTKKLDFLFGEEIK